jgi:hypothetical protein
MATVGFNKHRVAEVWLDEHKELFLRTHDDTAGASLRGQSFGPPAPTTAYSNECLFNSNKSFCYHR